MSAWPRAGGRASNRRASVLPAGAVFACVCSAAGHTQLNVLPQNQERFDRLQALAPIDAVRAWLEGDFGIGDDPALITAVRRDMRVSLSDDAIAVIIGDAMDEGLDAHVCLELLAGSNK